MKIELDSRLSARENAARLYEEAKRLRAKAESARRAIEETKKKLAELEKKIEKEKKEKQLAQPRIKIKREKEWYEKFHWFFTSDGFLVIAGRDAQQNDFIVSKYFEKDDLFFHADIQGAAATILKNGTRAPSRSLDEAAQFAACFSRAWKNENTSVDVYAVGKEQVSKHAPGGYIAKGGFAISGERKWFRGTPLALIIGTTDSGIQCIPGKCDVARFSFHAHLAPGGKEKGDVAKLLAKKFGAGADINEILGALPSGKSNITS
ncbi:MAG: NFACT RNA binding domain-containing protein [Candidatus Micrarchaeota archaeon]